MFEQLMVFGIIASWVAILLVWFFRKSIGWSLCEKWLRIIGALQFLPALCLLLSQQDISIYMVGIFFFSWICSLIWLWKTRIICPACFAFIVRGLYSSKHCPKCGCKVGVNA